MNLCTFNKKKPSIQLGPFSYLTPSIRTAAVFFCVLLLPQILMLALTKSFLSLVIIAQATVASLCGEVLFQMISKKTRSNYLMALIQGILTGFLVPQTYPPLGVFFICLASFVLSKYAFGGFSTSWVNPVAFTVAMLYFLSPQSFPGITITAQELRSRNAALTLIQNGDVKILSNDSSITNFFNTYVFSFFGIAIPDGYVSLFWDSSSIIPAFRFNILTLFSSLVLISFDILDALIPAVFIATYTVLVKLFSPLSIGGEFGSGDAILCLFTSGTLFCTTFLLQWYGTSPLTTAGKIFYGFLAAALAYGIIGFGTSSAGFVFTILLMNFASPVIQLLEEHYELRSIRHNLVPKIKILKEIDHE